MSRRRRRPEPGLLAALLPAFLLSFLSACGSPGAGQPGTGPTSVVAMGDSVASGEGTLYGYRYDAATGRWLGGDLNVAWPGPYPLCHDSPDAYGDVVAARFRARLAQFACTGSTFEGGIVGPKFEGVLEARPAQFGNWARRSGLNPAYDRARPDLVLISLGADDVRFTSVVRSCIENRLEDLVTRAPLQCTAADPGATFEEDVTAALPTLQRDLATLADWVEARGRADHRVPKVVFTTYYDPFPTGDRSCPDTELLAGPQVRFLSAALAHFDQDIVTAIGRLHQPEVDVVNLFDAFDGHRWCSAQPWAYGLSIFRLSDPASLLSAAPFHPTPAGQRAIAGRVEEAVQGSPGGGRGRVR